MALDRASLRRCRVRLYVAGESPHSLTAMRNLRSLAERYPELEIDVIDVLAMATQERPDDVHVMPTLVRWDPEPVVHIVGDLDDEHAVVESLGLT